MQLLVFSDTHGSSGKMLDVIDRNAKDAEAVLFLGDGEEDANAIEAKYPRLPLYRVAGNCDYASFCPESGLAAFGGVLFFYTHGHNYGVKAGLDKLAQEAKARGADAALFGHTHIAHYEKRNGIHLFNPGSLTIPRGGGPSYGRITLQNNLPNFEIIEYSIK